MFSEELKVIAREVNTLGLQQEEMLRLIKGQALVIQFLLGALHKGCPLVTPQKPGKRGRK